LFVNLHGDSSSNTKLQVSYFVKSLLNNSLHLKNALLHLGILQSLKVFLSEVCQELLENDYSSENNEKVVVIKQQLHNLLNTIESQESIILFRETVLKHLLKLCDYGEFIGLISNIFNVILDLNRLRYRIPNCFQIQRIRL
jgi:hypothetical protein